MSRKEREKKRIKKKRMRLILISFIFIYLFFRSVPSLFAMAFRTILPESVIIEDKIETEAIVIKKESIHKAEGMGKVEIFVDEGEKVAAGTKIAQLSLLDETSTLKQELDELNKKIDVLAKTEKDSEMIKIDEEKIEEGIEGIIDAIQNSISSGDYEKTEILKEKLSIYYGKQKEITGEDTLVSYSLENLKANRDKLLKQITSNTINSFSQTSGIVSYLIDGYEEIYSYNDKEDYGYSDFKAISNKQKLIENHMDVDYGEPIFKVIDNFEWYMVVKIDNIKDIDSYEIGDSINISADKVEGEIKGYIRNINREGNKGTVLCNFNTDFQDYYDKRLIDVNIIKYKYEGFKIPSKSIVEKDGIKGVYIKDISGIIKFKPIEILKEEDKFTYINRGDKNNKIKVKGSDKLAKTVTIYDEILQNTKNIKEGMIIN